MNTTYTAVKFYEQLQQEELFETAFNFDFSKLEIKKVSIEELEIKYNLKPLEYLPFWNWCRFQFGQLEGEPLMFAKIEIQIQWFSGAEYYNLQAADLLAFLDRFDIEFNRIKETYYELWEDSKIPSSGFDEMLEGYQEEVLLNELTNKDVTKQEAIYKLPIHQVLKDLCFRKKENEMNYFKSIAK